MTRRKPMTSQRRLRILEELIKHCEDLHHELAEMGGPIFTEEKAILENARELLEELKKE